MSEQEEKRRYTGCVFCDAAIYLYRKIRGPGEHKNYSRTC
jgi:hypothetical protein